MMLEKDIHRAVEPPLWSIGLAATVILLAPMVMYSLAPPGPIRDGDTIFSNGTHKVHLSEPLRYAQVGYQETCLIDPKDPLIVLHSSPDPPNDLILVQVQGKSRIEWPFCPPQAEILVRPHHILQKSNFFQEIRDSITRIFRG
ncbi:MAG: hypothetical protein ABW047_17775 [Nitrospiraceae bacterium]